MAQVPNELDRQLNSGVAAVAAGETVGAVGGVSSKGSAPGEISEDSALEEMAAVLADGPLDRNTESAVLSGLRDTPNLSQSEIAPEVLDQLLPDEYVVLPKVRRVAGGLAYRFVKRAFDVAACGAALVVLAIPMAVIAVKVKCESPGPAIYAQTREGKNGRPFKIYKFRSMYIDAEARGAQWAADGDPRITPLGKRLRNTRLDEIPQFWNVVRGDMSLVGPRPERPAFCAAFRERIDGWDQRTLVRPGITGYAQISGGYELLPKEKAALDIEYLENRSLLLDVKIMLSTLGVLKTGEGAR